ncbi:hypothetical protein ACTFIZ_012363 [Dictyostelium cf. discoideum]
MDLKVIEFCQATAAKINQNKCVCITKNSNTKTKYKTNKNDEEERYIGFFNAKGVVSKVEETVDKLETSQNVTRKCTISKERSRRDYDIGGLELTMEHEKKKTKTAHHTWKAEKEKVIIENTCNTDSNAGNNIQTNDGHQIQRLGSIGNKYQYLSNFEMNMSRIEMNMSRIEMNMSRISGSSGNMYFFGDGIRF